MLEAVKTNPGGYKEVLAELSFLRDYKRVCVSSEAFWSDRQSSV